MSISAISDYHDALKTYKPAQFVPDTAIDNNAPKITPLNPSEISQLTGNDGAMETAAVSDVPGFGDMVKSFVGDVNDHLTSSDEKTRELLAGKTHDTGAVVTSVEEANLEMQFALAVRNKLVTAYQTISQMTY